MSSDYIVTYDNAATKCLTLSTSMWQLESNPAIGTRSTVTTMPGYKPDFTFTAIIKPSCDPPIISFECRIIISLRNPGLIMAVNLVEAALYAGTNDDPIDTVVDETHISLSVHNHHLVPVAIKNVPISLTDRLFKLKIHINGVYVTMLPVKTLQGTILNQNRYRFIAYSRVPVKILDVTNRDIPSHGELMTSNGISLSYKDTPVSITMTLDVNPIAIPGSESYDIEYRLINNTADDSNAGNHTTKLFTLEYTCPQLVMNIVDTKPMINSLDYIIKTNISAMVEEKNPKTIYYIVSNKLDASYKVSPYQKPQSTSFSQKMYIETVGGLLDELFDVNTHAANLYRSYVGASTKAYMYGYNALNGEPELISAFVKSYETITMAYNTTSKKLKNIRKTISNPTFKEIFLIELTSHINLLPYVDRIICILDAFIDNYDLLVSPFNGNDTIATTLPDYHYLSFNIEQLPTDTNIRADYYYEVTIGVDLYGDSSCETMCNWPISEDDICSDSALISSKIALGQSSGTISIKDALRVRLDNKYRIVTSKVTYYFLVSLFAYDNGKGVCVAKFVGPQILSSELGYLIRATIYKYISMGTILNITPDTQYCSNYPKEQYDTTMKSLLAGYDIDLNTITLISKYGMCAIIKGDTMN